jgi:hypothetical protein
MCSMAAPWAMSVSAPAGCWRAACAACEGIWTKADPRRGPEEGATLRSAYNDAKAILDESLGQRTARQSAGFVK